MREEHLFTIDEFEKAEKFWLEKLSGELNQMNLLGDFPRLKQYEKATYKIAIGNQLTEKILHISKNNNLSIYIILLTAFKILLSRQSGQKEITVVSPIYNLENQEYNKFVVLRDFVEPALTFKHLLMSVKQTVIEAYKNEHYPTANIMKLLNIPDSTVLFRVFLLFETIHDNTFISEIINNYESDIIFSIRENQQNLEGSIIYNSKLFNKETIQVLFNRYLRILTQALNQAGTKISEIQWMTEEEKQRVLYEFNETERDYPGNNTAHKLFERQAKKTPDRAAVHSTISTTNIYDDSRSVDLDVHLDYEELNKRANLLAYELRGKGVTVDSIVGIMVQHPLEMAVSILGVLKAGGAYLPLDPEFPPKVKSYILEDSNMKLLLTERPFIEELPGAYSSLPILLTDEDSFVENEPSTPEIMDHSSDLAYIIYTSGTTGRPKGTLVEHRGIVNYTYWRIKTYNYSESDVTLQMLSYCFDGFGSNFYSSLLSGGTLVIVPDAKKLDFDYIKQIIAKKKVTNISVVPSMYETLIADGQEELKTLRFVVLAGERSSATLVKKSKERLPGTRLINEYGPTEATVTAAALLEIEEFNTAVIGTPIANTYLYIIDRFFQPVPVNVPGELLIAGPGVARGYLNNPELTAEKFIDPLEQASLFPTPYSSHHPLNPSTIYQTGDMARWLADGNIEFLGRVDHQVKIRGFRIELAEIENRLLEHDKIKGAVVLTKDAVGDESVNQYVCAYIVSNETIEIPQVREFLAEELPHYMIPLYFARLERFPLTATGKVDRKALAEYEAGEIRVKYVMPRNDIEKKFAEIWQEVLGIEKIGIRDNFFEMGGDSLKAIRVISRLNSLGIDITVNEIFDHQTIDKICVNMAPGEETADDVERLENYVLENYGCKAYYREYQMTDNSYRAILYILRERFPIDILLKDINEKYARQYSINYITFIKSEEEIIRENKIEDRLLSNLMGLKTRLTGEDEKEISEELHKNKQLSLFLKRNKESKRYGLSPIQKRWLSGTPKDIPKKLISFSYDFTHSTDFREIRDIVVELVNKNSLLRSIIVTDKGDYFIKEFGFFSNIEVPFVDISNYSFDRRQAVEKRIEQILWEPLELRDNPLYRLAVLKLDISTFKLIFVFNHFIFDAESSRILEEQIRDINLRKTNNDAYPAESKKNNRGYDDYVRFMEDLTYEDVRLEKYFDLEHYLGSVEHAHEKFTIRELQRDALEIDISDMKGSLKDFYNEILLLCYAKVIGKLFEMEKVPIALYANGRNYKSKNFNHIIGLFIDHIPYVFSFGKHWDPKITIEGLLNYKEHIRENNLNFINYFMKDYAAEKQPTLLSPFAFNAIMGFYDYFKKEDKDEILKKLRGYKIPGSIFEMIISRDLHSDKLYIIFLQNSHFSGRVLTEKFLTIYNEIVNDLNASNILPEIGS